MELKKLSYKRRILRVAKLRSSCGFVMGLSLPKQKNECTIWHSRVPPRYNCNLIFLDDDSFRASRLSKHQSCSQMLSAARAATNSHMEQVQYSVEINRTDKGKNIYAIQFIFFYSQVGSFAASFAKRVRNGPAVLLHHHISNIDLAVKMLPSLRAAVYTQNYGNG